MESVKILHCADVHIGASESFLGAAAKKRRFETLMTFEKILSAARDNDVSLLLIAGDLFDSNLIEPEFADRVFEGFHSIPEIQVVFAAGNHDPLDAQSPFCVRTLPENVHVLGSRDECICFDGIKTRVYGRSFSGVYMHGEEHFSLKIPEDNYINIMVQHGEATGNINSDYNAVTPDFVRSCGMDYIALGHIHKRSDVVKMGGTSFAYCGCPEGQGFDELDEKGVYLGTVSKGGCALEFLPLSRRKHICEQIDISSCESACEIAPFVLRVLEEKYTENFGDHLYKLILTGEIPEEINLSTEEISSRVGDAVYFVKVRDNTTIKADLEQLANEKSLKGIFVKKMLGLIRESTEQDAQRLRYALNLGLKAFRAEVDHFDDQ